MGSVHSDMFVPAYFLEHQRSLIMHVTPICALQAKNLSYIGSDWSAVPLFNNKELFRAETLYANTYMDVLAF
jgi:hypothetical protein